MNELGQKIRALRKEQKLTLDGLAGERLSKGMLSLIENGKAQPSIESLHYIAERLGVEVTVLLQASRIDNLADIVLEAEKLLADYGKTFYAENVKEAFEELMAPIASKLQKNSYEEIRLLDISYRFQMAPDLSLEDAQYEELAKLYAQVHAYDRMMYCYLMIAWKYFYAHQFEKSLRILQEAEQKMEAYRFHVSDLTRLEVYYNGMVLTSALQDEARMDAYYERALALSSEKRVYFKIDDMYRLKFALHMGKGELALSARYLQRIEAMTHFVDDETTELLYVLCECYYHAFVTKDYAVMQTFINRLVVLLEKEPEEMHDMLHVVKLLLLHGEGRYEEALAIGKQIVIPFYMHHPLDLAMYYMISAVRAHCYAALGYREEAKRDLLYAKESMKPYDLPYFQQFIAALETAMNR